MDSRPAVAFSEKAQGVDLCFTGLGAPRDGNFASGVTHWSACLELNLAFAAGHHYRAQCVAPLRQEAVAIGALQRALEREPARCSARQVRGSRLAKTKNLEEARSQFERSLKWNSEQALAALNLAKV